MTVHKKTSQAAESIQELFSIKKELHRKAIKIITDAIWDPVFIGISRFFDILPSDIEVIEVDLIDNIISLFLLVESTEEIIRIGVPIEIISQTPSEVVHFLKMLESKSSESEDGTVRVAEDELPTWMSELNNDLESANKLEDPHPENELCKAEQPEPLSLTAEQMEALKLFAKITGTQVH